MTNLRLSLLGGFQARAASGAPLAIPLKKAQMLLAYLALTPGQAHARDKLATLLWSDASADQARHNLRQTLFALRGTLPSTPSPLRTDGENLTLDESGITVDVREFARLAVEGTVDEL